MACKARKSYNATLGKKDKAWNHRTRQPFLPPHCIHCKYSIVDNQRKKERKQKIQEIFKVLDRRIYSCLYGKQRLEREREIPAHRENEKKGDDERIFLCFFFFHSSNADGLRMHCH